MPEIETTFVDVTSIVPASWWNRIQKHLAGFMNLKVSISGDSVQVTATSSDGVASCYIGGEMRRNDSTVSHTFVAEGADTYNVYAVATAAVDTFAVEVSTTTPATSPYRKIAEVDWDAADITALRGVRARVIEHTHDGYAQPPIEHNDLADGATGDPHTQYVLADGSRAFTGTVGGVTPTSAAHLATKGYADAVLLEVPVGTIIWWPSADPAPSGFLLSQGQEVSRTTYDKLFARIGTTYGTGDGSTTFNLPDVRGRMIAGAADQGELGETGGAIVHSHSQTAHTHTQDAHTHTAGTHSHSGAATGSGGSHTHTQGDTGAGGGHSHTSAAHLHGAGSLAVGTSGTAIVGARHGTDDQSGLFAEDDLDNTSTPSHSHGDGTYLTCDPSVFLTGTTGSTGETHAHPPAGNAYEHTHGAASVSGNTGTAGAAATSSESNHTHTNPPTAAGGSHTHSSGGSTGTASPGANSGGDIETESGGDDTTGTATFPYLTAHALIRYE